MKRILFIMEDERGGAEKSLAKVAKKAEEQGHGVEVMKFMLPFSRILLAPFAKLFVKGMIRRIEQYITTVEPDEVHSQHFFAPLCAEICERRDVPFCLYLRDMTNFGHFDRRDFSGIKRIIYAPFFEYYARAQERAIRKADIVIANSEFMARKCMEKFDVEAIVQYPEIDVSKFSIVVPSMEFIGMMGTSKSKGIDVFIELARRFPRERFLLAGKDLQRGLPPNIEFIGWAEPREFFARLKMLIVPSQWEEPFGRVAIEGMACGVPVLASAVGGLPETGAQTVADFTNIEAWEKTLRALLEQKSDRGD